MVFHIRAPQTNFVLWRFNFCLKCFLRCLNFLVYKFPTKRAKSQHVLKNSFRLFSAVQRQEEEWVFSHIHLHYIVQNLCHWINLWCNKHRVFFLLHCKCNKHLLVSVNGTCFRVKTNPEICFYQNRYLIGFSHVLSMEKWEILLSWIIEILKKYASLVPHVQGKCQC